MFRIRASPDEVLQRVDLGDVSIGCRASRYMTRGIPAGNFGLRRDGAARPARFPDGVRAAEGRPGASRVQRERCRRPRRVVQQQQLVTGQRGLRAGPVLLISSILLASPARHTSIALALRAAGRAATPIRPQAGGTIAVVPRRARVATSSSIGNAELGRFLRRRSAHRRRICVTVGTFRRLYARRRLRRALERPLGDTEVAACARRKRSRWRTSRRRGDTIGNISAEQSPAGTTPVLRLLRGPASGASARHGHVALRRCTTSIASTARRASIYEHRHGRSHSVMSRAARRSRRRRRTGAVPAVFGLEEDAPADQIECRADLSAFARHVRNDDGCRSRHVYRFPALQPFLESGAGAERGDLCAAAAQGRTRVQREQRDLQRSRSGQPRSGRHASSSNFDYRVKAGRCSRRRSISARSAFVTKASASRWARTAAARCRLRNRLRHRPAHAARSRGRCSQRIPAQSSGDMGAEAAVPDCADERVRHERALLARSRADSSTCVGMYPGGEIADVTATTRHGARLHLPRQCKRSVDLGGALLDRVFGKFPGSTTGRIALALKLTAEIALSSPESEHARAMRMSRTSKRRTSLRVDPRRQNWVLGFEAGVVTVDGENAATSR